MHEFFVGYLSNVIPTYLFFPLDTLMVRLQTGDRCRSHLFSGVHRASQMNGLVNGLITMVYFGNRNETPLSNFLGGVVSGVFFHPIENKKIYAQTHTKVPPSLTRGLSITLFREVIAVPVYFQTYEFLKQRCEDKTSLTCHYLCGGVAGVHSWLWSYPLSTIKANYILHQPFHFHPSFLYKGFLICAIRSFFINGTCFVLRERLT